MPDSPGKIPEVRRPFLPDGRNPLRLPETLEPAAEQFRKDPYGQQHTLTPKQVEDLREYLREWMRTQGKDHPQAKQFVAKIDSLNTQQEMCEWLHNALVAGISPI